MTQYSVTVNTCIYCRADVPDDAPPEHVIPQGFGVFTPDLTLDCLQGLRPLLWHNS